MKNLSGRLARKHQRSIAGQCWSLRKIQTVLDAAVVDRCEYVEICCSDAPCLTEAMQQRGISSFSLLRSDGVGNHDAQTREKLLGRFSEKRSQKAGFSPPVIDRFFDSFFGCAAAVLQFGGHIYWEWPAKCAGWSSVELREFKA